MRHAAPITAAAAALYASYVVRVWRTRPGGFPVRVDVEHVQSGQRLAADPDALADLVARLAAGFPIAPGPDPPVVPKPSTMPPAAVISQPQTGDSLDPKEGPRP